MSSSFTDGTTAVLPEVVDGYQATRSSRHVFNPRFGTNADDVVVYPAGPRTGTLTAVFASYPPAAALLQLLSGTSPIQFDDSERPEIGMTFLADGSIGINQSDGRTVWIVTVDFREVLS